MAGYRRGSLFVRNALEHSTPLDRNAIARILYLAERLELRTKGSGCRNGCLGAAGVAVLRVLLLRFLNRATGLCCPSYTAIQAATGLCRQTVADALKRLARAGIVRWIRRIDRAMARDGRLIPKQASNLYRIGEPAATAVLAADTALTTAGTARAKPFPKRGPLAALAALATLGSRESARKTVTIQADIPIASYVTPARTSWRERARASLEKAVAASRGK